MSRAHDSLEDTMQASISGRQILDMSRPIKAGLGAIKVNVAIEPASSKTTSCLLIIAQVETNQRRLNSSSPSRVALKLSHQFW